MIIPMDTIIRFMCASREATSCFVEAIVRMRRAIHPLLRSGRRARAHGVAMIASRDGTIRNEMLDAIVYVRAVDVGVPSKDTNKRL